MPRLRPRNEVQDRRSIEVIAFGDTPEQMELYALDKAREFFGPDLRLRVRPDYTASEPLHGTRRDRALQTGKRFTADVVVGVATGTR